MSKMHYIIYTILIFIILGLGYIIYTGRVNEMKYRKIIDLNENKIDKLETQIKHNKHLMDLYMDTIARYKDIQNKYEELAKKYQHELDKNENSGCCIRADLYQKKSEALDTALQRCKQTQALYVKTSGLCLKTIKHYDTITITQSEILRLTKKEKRRNIGKGIALGAGSTLILTLILLTL